LVAAVSFAAGWRWIAVQGVDWAALTPAEAARLVRGYGAWGVAASLLLMVIHSFVPFPSEVIAFANGMVFGPALGIAVTWVGAMLGAVLAFALARGLGRPFVRLVLADERRRRIEAVPQHWSMLLLVRLVPLISFNLINYAAGLMGVGWVRFLWTTALGILPVTIALVVLGDRMGAAPAWAWSLLVLAVLVSWWLWRRTK
jgi:uncharacterized membrane protein YdjX (TVP38/TMEM64 family)